MYLLGVLQSLYLFKSAGNFWTAGALFFPVGLAFYQGLFFRALGRKRDGGTVEWKGRHVS